MAFLQVWAPLAAQFDLLALDLPGFGGSQGRPDVIAPEAMGNFIVAAVRHFGLARPRAVGPDIGTSALLFAAALLGRGAAGRARDRAHVTGQIMTNLVFALQSVSIAEGREEYR